jgi:uncharacterized protein (DUF2384 family)
VTIQRNINFNMPAEAVKLVDQMARLELITRADWARRAVVNALRQAESDRIAKEARR